MMKKLFVLILALMLLPDLVIAENGGWTCLSCGQRGNTGNYCFNCAAPRPDGTWTCPKCGQTGNTGNYCPNCAAPRPETSAIGTDTGMSAPADIGIKVDPELEQIPGESDKVKIRLMDAQANTFIANKKNPALWSPLKAVDGDESTCWQFSAKKMKKAWITLLLSKDDVTVDEIWIKNGFWAYNDKGKDQYPLNARLKKIRVEFIYTNTNIFEDGLEFTLPDSREDWVRLDIGQHFYVAGVRITPLSIYKGSAFPNDVCMSEVMLVQNAPAEIAMPPEEIKGATVYESRADITGVGLKMRLATRSGPGNEYEEPGTFFIDTWQDQTVRVLKKKNVRDVWWVQVDFRNGTKSRYRVWTGEKRVDVDLNRVKEEMPICACDIRPTSDTYFGPGGDYAKAGFSINRSAVGNIFGRENGYVDVEFWYEDDGFNGNHRVWVPESAVYNLYYGDESGEY